MKNKIKKAIILFGAVFFLVFCVEVYSQSSAQEKAMKNLETAKKKFEADPGEENTIWYGRRTAYLGKYKEAIDIYTGGLTKFPNSYKLYRHRGHRYVSTRRFKKAIADFKKGAELVQGKGLEVEPDGLPNAANIPLSNTQFNIYYHLGLAYYLTRDFDGAVGAYKECLKWCNNDDSIVAVTHWLYMTYRRMNKTGEARKVLDGIKEKMNIIEDHDYHALVLMYKGLKKPAEVMNSKREGATGPAVGSATRGYGIGNWYYYNGETVKAKTIFDEILKAGGSAAFGYIAAEADVKDLK
ncbi:MAG: tetratricopeptide repeat protein [bacterium]|nr:tetratricopeptide repeat protein [bacterium]